MMNQNTHILVMEFVFDGKGNLSFSDATNGKNVMTLGVDMTPYYPPITEGEKSYIKEEQ